MLLTHFVSNTHPLLRKDVFPSDRPTGGPLGCLAKSDCPRVSDQSRRASRRELRWSAERSLRSGPKGEQYLDPGSRAAGRHHASLRV